MEVQVSLLDLVFNSFEYIPRSGTDDISDKILRSKILNLYNSIARDQIT